jgi:mRNA-degrading endonuclease RelE of RelBE toxin-antitoxin system
VPKASYSVVVVPSAAAELGKVPFPFRRQLNQKIFNLKDAPRPSDVELIEGDLFVFELDRWGLLYEVDDENLRLTVLAFVDLGDVT